nr:hypothetical protein [uncultured Roseococcus sp.]
MSGKVGEDEPQLLIGGQVFTGWMDLRVTRGIERCAADFLLHAEGAWPGEEADWPIRAFAPCTIRFGEDDVLTGYIDGIEHKLDPTQREIRVDGRSKTADLIDCSALIDGGEFRDSSFAAICRSVARPFDIEVLDSANVGSVVIPTEAADQTEECFPFLERLARQASVLLTDDARGRLVIARTSAARCSSEIREGDFISAVLMMQVEKRFDRYVVKGQLPAMPAWIERVAREAGAPRQPGADARPGITSPEVRDAAVPRYRPYVMQAEGNADAAQARARAVWQARRDAAASLMLKVLMPGWRQADGRLWQINEVVPVDIPSLGAKDDMLIASVSHTLDKEGRRTLLTLGLTDAYTPAPISPPTGGRSSLASRLPAGGGAE